MRLGYKDCSNFVYKYPTQWVQIVFEGAFLFSCLSYLVSVHKIIKQCIKQHCPIESATYKTKVAGCNRAATLQGKHENEGIR